MKVKSWLHIKKKCCYSKGSMNTKGLQKRKRNHQARSTLLIQKDSKMNQVVRAVDLHSKNNNSIMKSKNSHTT